MQAVSKQNIDRWLHENQYTYGSLALKREDKPNQPRQTKQAARIPLESTWRQILVRYLLDVAKMAIACAIGVALGLMFVWSW